MQFSVVWHLIIGFTYMIHKSVVISRFVFLPMSCSQGLHCEHCWAILPACLLYFRSSTFPSLKKSHPNMQQFPSQRHLIIIDMPHIEKKSKISHMK